MPFQPRQDRPVPSSRAPIATGFKPSEEPTKATDPEKPSPIRKRQHPAMDVISLKTYDISPHDVARLMFG